MKFYCEDTEKVLSELGTSSDGLTTEEAERRLSENVRNRLKETKGKSLIRRFFEQLRDLGVKVKVESNQRT